MSVTNLSPPSLNTRTLSVLGPLGIQHSAGTEQRDSEGVPGGRYWNPSPEGPRDPPGLWAWPLPIQRPAWPPPLAEATSNEDTGKGPEVSVQGAECVHRDARLTFCLCFCWGVTPASHATHGCSSGLCDTRETSGVLMVFYMMGLQPSTQRLYRILKGEHFQDTKIPAPQSLASECSSEESKGFSLPHQRPPPSPTLT